MDNHEYERPARVLVAHYLPNVVSGAERSIADFVKKADKSRLECIMLTPGKGSLADYYRDCGFTVWSERIETPRRKYPGLHLVQSLWYAAQLKKREVDIIVSNTFSASSRVSTAARFAGISNAIYIREFISDRPLHRKMLQQADGIFTISKDLQGYLAGMTDPEKVCLAYNYIDPSPILERARVHRTSGKRALPFGKEVSVIGLIGRITRFKQQDLLIQAAPKVLEQFPEAHFVIVGSAQENENDYLEYLHQLVCDLGLENRVFFLGQRKDAIEITSELTISCLTSDREPLGRVILEAHLLGCPVIVSNRGGPAEIVEDGRTGLLFPSTGPEATDRLAEGIIRLLKEPGLRKRLASAAKEKVGVTFASMDHVHKQENYILALCHSKKFQKQINHGN